MSKKKIILRYKGSGNTLPGVPARDLAEDEMVRYAKRFLVSTGLYETVKRKPLPLPDPEPQED